ncbi:AAA family ATPase [Deinococcus ruber]|uniref:Bacterial transcriptional activator domain-containing protein n=1 Tax=Deinococcus ruber TaxID=1848197 RepID=A0A918FGP7_9DEIO|nr:AAA family ATPase [Deinococcus ruber]GGR36631.1 hypothetical protein GCM10008957_52860 [Deinococcus ruber]
MPTSSWHLSLLGVPQLRSPANQVIRCDGKPMALLALLSLEGRISRVRLADLLWPGVSETTGRNNLVNLLRRLRQKLGTEVWISGDSLALSPEVEVDVLRLLANGSEQAPPGTGRLLEGYDWPDLPDFFDWLLAWRARLDALWIRQTMKLSAHLEAQQRYSGALEAARHALTFDPLSEEVHRSVMRLLYLGGDPAAAQQAYEACCAVLHTHLKTEPMPQTRELMNRIRQGLLTSSDGAGQTRPLSAPPPKLRATRLIGREHEWARMEQAWTQGQTIFLVGEAGSGKSRLAAEFVARKGEGLLFEGRPGDITVPFASATRVMRRVLSGLNVDLLPGELRDRLARLLPEVQAGPSATNAGVPAPAPATPQQERAQLQDALQTLLVRGLSNKVALIADDLQYSDDASIEVCLELAAMNVLGNVPGDRSAARPTIVCYRPAELASTHRAALAQLVKSGDAVQIEIVPLSEVQVRELLGGLPVPNVQALVEPIMHLSGGNPMHVLEAARHLIERRDGGAQAGLPPRLELLMTMRLERLPAVALSVARAASVLQHDFTPEQVAEMLDLPLLETAAAWDELTRAELVAGERFSHDLVAEVILGHIPVVVKRLLHRAAARTLAGAGAAPARVARQWLDGGEQLSAAPWLLQAVSAAQRLFRHREAVGFAAQAAQILEAAGRREEAYDAWIQRAHLLADLEDQDTEQIRAVQDLHRTAVSVSQQAQAYLLEARLHFKSGDASSMVRASEQGLTLARSQPNVHLEGELQEVLGMALLVARQPIRSAAAWTRLLELGQMLTDERFQASAQEGLGYLLSFTQPASAPWHYEQAEQGFVTLGDPARAATSAQKASLLAFQHGNIPSAIQILLRAQGYVAPLEGHNVTKLLLAESLSRAWLAQEEYTLALDTLDQAEETHGLPSLSRSGAVALHRALILTRLGATEQARQLLEPLLNSTQFPNNMKLQLKLTWGNVLRMLGQTREAHLVCEQALALLATQDQAHSRVRLALLQSLLAPLHCRDEILSSALRICRQHKFRALEAAVQVRLCASALECGHAPTELPDALPDATEVGPEELWSVRLINLRRENADAAHLLAMEERARAWLETVSRRVPSTYLAHFIHTRGRFLAE